LTKFRNPYVVSTTSVRIWEHAGYGVTSPSAGGVRVLNVNVRPRAHNALPPQVFFIILLSLAPRTAHVVSAWSVRGPCLLATSSVQLSKKRTELMRTLPSKNVLSSYNARCAQWPTPNSGRNKLTLPHMYAFATGERVRIPYVLRNFNARCAKWPTSNSGRNKLTLPHMYAFATGERVRIPYVLRTFNARCANWPTPNSSRNKLTFTALAVASKNIVRDRVISASVR